MDSQCYHRGLRVYDNCTHGHDEPHNCCNSLPAQRNSSVTVSTICHSPTDASSEWVWKECIVTFLLPALMEKWMIQCLPRSNTFNRLGAIDVRAVRALVPHPSRDLQHLQVRRANASHVTPYLHLVMRTKEGVDKNSLQMMPHSCCRGTGTCHPLSAPAASDSASLRIRTRVSLLL